jgi:hypothetical protein
MATSTTKKVLAEFAWNDITPPASTTRKLLAEFAWNDITPPASTTRKLLAEFAWADFIPSSGGTSINFPFAERTWGQGDSIIGMDTIKLWGLE